MEQMAVKDLIVLVTCVVSAISAVGTALFVAVLNSKFTKKLKEHEFNLAYQKKIAEKRMAVYDELIGLVLSIFQPEVVDASGNVSENYFKDADLLNNYTVDLFNFVKHLPWLSKEAQIKYAVHRKAAVEMVDMWDADHSLEKPAETTEGKHLRLTSLRLHNQLMSDYFHLHEIDELAAAYSVAPPYDNNLPHRPK